MLLSRRSTARLNDLQSLLSAYLVRSEGAGERIDQVDYTAITETCSALRTALTADLSTREQRTIVGVMASWRWHRLESRKAKRRIDAIGRGKMSYPRKKLDL